LSHSWQGKVARFRVLPEDNSLAKIEPPSWLTQTDLEAVTK